MRALILVACLLPLAASAQRGRPFAQKGDVALVVALSAQDLLAVRPALGGVGVRYRLTDRNVVGTSVGFSLGRGERNGGDESTSRLSVAFWNESHLSRRPGLVSPFVGGGVVVTARRSEQDMTPCGGDPSCGPTSIVRTYRSETIAAGALLGAEVRVARGVTLGAAYTLGVEASRDRYSEIGTPRFPDDAWNVRVGTGLTDVLLSVYF